MRQFSHVSSCVYVMIHAATTSASYNHEPFVFFSPLLFVFPFHSVNLFPVQLPL